MKNWVHVMTSLAIVAFSGPAMAYSQQGFGEEATSAVRIQSDGDALAQDLDLAAQARGWSLGQARANYHASEAVGEIAEQIYATEPEIFVGSAVGPYSVDTPTVFVKGPADEFVRGLVAAADLPIRLVDNQPFSFAELRERRRMVHDSLVSMGYEVATWLDIVNRGRIHASITYQPGLDADPGRILERLPADIRDDVALEMSELPAASELSAFGGMWVLDNGLNECTSGWSVVSPANTTGVTSAGHCTSIDQINHPGHGLHALSYLNGHEGQWGDVEWYTSTQTEPDDFYANATTIRDVAFVEAWANISIDEVICYYGRSSNLRDCSLHVVDVDAECAFYDRLVLMNAPGVARQGDSGGGFSSANKAYGSISVFCGGTGWLAFSVADHYDEAILVSVRT